MLIAAPAGGKTPATTSDPRALRVVPSLWLIVRERAGLRAHPLPMPLPPTTRTPSRVRGKTPAHSLPDEKNPELFRLAAGGDEAAQTRLWNACAPFMRAAARRIIFERHPADRDLVEDAVVEAFMYVLRSNATLRNPVSRMVDITKRKARSRLANALEMRKRRPVEQGVESFDAFGPEMIRAAEEQAAQREAATAVAALRDRIEAMADPHRRVLFALFIEGHTLATVEAAFGRSDTWVRARRDEGLALLREWVQSTDEIPSDFSLRWERGLA